MYNIPYILNNEFQLNQMAMAYSPLSSSCSLAYSNSTVIHQKKIKKQKEEFQKGQKGHWTTEEHEVYEHFLMLHKDTTIQNQMNKKNNKIFKVMSLTVGTRSPAQCRSHHQKFNPLTPQGLLRLNKGHKRITNGGRLISQIQLEKSIQNDKQNLPCNRKLDFQNEELLIPIEPVYYQNYTEAQQFYPQYYFTDEYAQPQMLICQVPQVSDDLVDYLFKLN